MFPTPKPLEPMNSDAGISGDVTFSQTPGVPVAGGSGPPVPAVPVVPAPPPGVCVLLPQPHDERERERAEDLETVHGLVRSKKDATLRIAHRRRSRGRRHVYEHLLRNSLRNERQRQHSLDGDAPSMSTGNERLVRGH